MDRKYRFLFWLVPAVVVFAAGFVIAAKWDLALSRELFDPDNLVASLFEAFGWLPAFLPVVLLALLWAAEGHASKEKRWRFPLGCLVAVCGFGALYNTCYHYLEKRDLADGPDDIRTWLWLALGVAVAIFAFWWVFSRGETLRHKLVFFALVGSVYMVANQLIINIVKTIWDRVRFDEMHGMLQAGFEAFTPWYLPGGGGGTSFPSGHTANACGIFLLVVLCDLFPSWNRRRNLVYVLCWGYVAAMAFTRILIGRHYLSDTMAAAIIMAILFFVLRRTKAYKKGLLQARSIGKAPQSGEVLDEI
ncbi:phosphatase PAP2 family protein [Ruminococcaceae bacterium OttesenSCG-928-I18]|nr:phosphatase PAP2 family protein [Ruminococcaceae bacterium OttesenSCG-928-I18]